VEPRPIYEIAEDIYKAWPKVNFAAAPYLDAMLSLDKITDRYYQDSGREIVQRFLTNAAAFRGDAARALKAELKALL
jgi:hypothetical protein